MLSRRVLLQAAVGLGRSRVRIGLNAYSFDRPLRAGALTLSDVVRFCADHGIQGLDATGYYFPGYPAVPETAYMNRLKREAFTQGVTIFGTGVRNDFATADAAARAKDVRMVKDWIEAAARLGASILRIFSGPRIPPGYTFDQVLEWMAPAIAECAEHGQRHGILLGLQNHNDFLKTAGETIRLIQAVHSPWLGVILDVGSLRQGDPYVEIEKVVPHAISWQLKELVNEKPIDLRRVKAIIDRAGYRGMLPIETLGAGDPKVKVARFLSEVRAVFG